MNSHNDETIIEERKPKLVLEYDLMASNAITVSPIMILNPPIILKRVLLVTNPNTKNRMQVNKKYETKKYFPISPVDAK